ncbi:MAG: subclass B1 metallo-beta-lactamase [Woeseiaceae bacterium]|nr:subclass B1 metallo-beta-lactamase [Woeseiaceae bacterium]
MIPSIRCLLIVGAMLASCAESPTVSEGWDDEHDGVRFTRIDESVWMHTSYATIEPWGPVRSNGIVVVGGKGAVLVDTAWNNRQTEAIIDWAQQALGVSISSAVFTHAHDDKMGGVEALRAAGIPTYAHPQSNLLAPINGLMPAEFDLVIAADGTASAPAESNGNLSLLQIYYPGPGHTADNIVALATGTGVLFGGCLVRPAGSVSLGNTADASIDNWEAAADSVVRQFPGAMVVIPSHGSPGGRELLSHTVDLARSAREAE